MVLAEGGVHQHMAHAGQGRLQLGHHRAAVDVTATIAHAVAGDQHLGLDLPEAVQHRRRAHVGRANAPDRAQADGRQKRHHRLRDIGQVGGHPVAGLNTLGTQVQRQRRHLAPQLGPADLPVFAGFVAADDGQQSGGVCRRHMAEHLLCVIDAGAFEPDRARHGVLLQYRAVRGWRLQCKVVPNALPKAVQITDRPRPERVIVIKVQAFCSRQPILVEADLGHKGRGRVVGLVVGLGGLPALEVWLLHTARVARVCGRCKQAGDSFSSGFVPSAGVAGVGGR